MTSSDHSTNGDSSADQASWLTDLLRTAALTGDEPLEEIMAAMDDLANRAAPIARSFWIWVVGIQSACVIIPVIWFIREAQGIPTILPAILCLVAILLLISALWWMRWRGMQRVWAQARLVSEVARARIDGDLGPEHELHPFLSQFPELEELPYPESSADIAWTEKKEHWIQERLEGQLAYYKKAKDKAEGQRSGITKGITLLMDVTFSVSIFAVVVFLTNRANQWRRTFGDYWLDWGIGILCLTFPLGLIALQILRSAWELNRRTAKFQRQISMLEHAREELESSDNEEHDLVIIRLTEQQLLGEVVDWYFETITAEEFFRVREGKSSSSSPAATLTTRGKDFSSRPARLAKASRMGARPAGFLIKVILGRLPWVLVAMAFTIAWINYRAGEVSDSQTKLTELGQLVTKRGEPWNSNPFRAKNGCIILAHGLTDRAYNPLSKDGEGAEGEEDLPQEPHWMDLMEDAFEARIPRSDHPNIIRIDWSQRAKPGQFEGLLPTDSKYMKMLSGVSGVKNQGASVGDFVAFRVFQLIQDGKIKLDAPIQLIGHSAGGFVISRAAILLNQYGLAPDMLRVTILDTPEPGNELLKELPLVCDNVEFYISSGFVQGLREKDPPKGVYVREVREPSLLNATTENHSYAYKWYTETIKKAKTGEDGFGLSPFAN